MHLSSRSIKRIYAIRESMWFTPVTMMFVGAGLALLLPLVDHRVFPPEGPGETALERFVPTASAAESLFATGMGALATILTLALSITIVTLQLAAVQYTSRIIRRFMADQLTLLVLGSYLATITYLAVMQQAISTGGGGEPAFVPPLSFTVGLVLFITCVMLLAVFSHHVAQSIQTGTVVAAIGKDTVREIHKELHERVHRVPQHSATPPPNGVTIHAKVPGYIQLIDERALITAVPKGTQLRLEAVTGQFILPGRPLLTFWPAVDLDRWARWKIHKAFAITRERTIHQDVLFGVRQLVDIILKALSPAINDVTTALMAINELGVIVQALAAREESTRAGYRVIRHRGRTLLMRRLDLETLLAHCFDEVPRAAADHPLVLARLLELLNELVESTHVPAAQKLLLDAGARIQRVMETREFAAWEADLVRRRFAWLNDGRDDRSWDSLDPI